MSDCSGLQKDAEDESLLRKKALGMRARGEDDTVDDRAARSNLSIKLVHVVLYVLFLIAYRRVPDHTSDNGDPLNRIIYCRYL